MEALDPGNRQATAAVERIRRKIEEQSQNLEQTSRKLEIVNLYDDALQAFNQGEYDKAIADLDRLLALEPGHEEAKNLRAMAKRKITPLSKQEEDEDPAALPPRNAASSRRTSTRRRSSSGRRSSKSIPTNESVKRNIEEAKERLKQLEERG